MEQEIEDIDGTPQGSLEEHADLLHEVRFRAKGGQPEQQCGEDQRAPPDPVEEIPHGQRRNDSYQRIRTAPAMMTARFSAIETP